VYKVTGVVSHREVEDPLSLTHRKRERERGREILETEEYEK
jgi:hypothetical protein